MYACTVDVVNSKGVGRCQRATLRPAITPPGSKRIVLFNGIRLSHFISPGLQPCHQWACCAIPGRATDHRGHSTGRTTARHAFAEWIEIAVAYPSAGQLVVAEKHRRKGFDVLSFLQRQQAQGDGNETRGDSDAPLERRSRAGDASWRGRVTGGRVCRADLEGGSQVKPSGDQYGDQKMIYSAEKKKASPKTGLTL